jgi:hypothetical protein
LFVYSSSVGSMSVKPGGGGFLVLARRIGGMVAELGRVGWSVIWERWER